MDHISLIRLKLLHPKVRDEAIALVEECNNKLKNGCAKMRIVQTLRSISEQNALYAQGRTKPGNIVTHAPGGYSYHNYGLALDFVLLVDDTEISWETDVDYNDDGLPDWMQIVSIFKRANWFWGGNFKSINKKDRPHFEKSFGLSVADLKQRYDRKNFVIGTYVAI